MKVYTISPEDNFAVIEIAVMNARDPLVDNVPLKLHGKKSKIPDVGFFVKPIFSQRALDILYPLISKDVNVVTTTLNNQKWYVIEVETELDALDYKNAEIDIISPTYTIPRKHAFLKSVIGDHSMFTLYNGRKAYTYVTEQFVKMVNDNNLTGIAFNLVWESSERTPTIQEKNVNNLFIETGNGMNTMASDYSILENIIYNINLGNEDYLTIKTDDGFMQLYGYDNKFVVELRINSEMDFTTYDLVKETKEDECRMELVTPYGVFTPISSHVVSLERVLEATKILYECHCLRKISSILPCVDTTESTKKYMGLI